MPAHPLFFEESWTLGAATAAENSRRRGGSRGVCFYGRRVRRVRQPGRGLMCSRWRGGQMILPPQKTTRAANEANAGWPLWRDEELASRVEDGAQDWEPFSQSRTASGRRAETMSMPLACRRWELPRTAHGRRSRRRTGQGRWHPDRMQHRSEDARRRANDQIDRHQPGLLPSARAMVAASLREVGDLASYTKSPPIYRSASTPPAARCGGPDAR